MSQSLSTSPSDTDDRFAAGMLAALNALQIAKDVFDALPAYAAKV